MADLIQRNASGLVDSYPKQKIPTIKTLKPKRIANKAVDSEMNKTIEKRKQLDEIIPVNVKPSTLLEAREHYLSKIESPRNI